MKLRISRGARVFFDLSDDGALDLLKLERMSPCLMKNKSEGARVFFDLGDDRGDVDHVTCEAAPHQ